MAKVYLDEMGNPIVSKPKVYLDSMGNPVVDTAARQVSRAPVASPIQTPTGPNVLRAPAGFRRAVQARQTPEESPDYASVIEGILTAGFPRLENAANAKRSFPRQVAAASLDVASLPTRALSSAFAAPGNDEVTFGDAMRTTNGPVKGLGDVEGLIHEIVRDPLNATLGARGFLGLGKVGAGASKLATKVPGLAAAAAKLERAAEGGSKLAKATKLVGQGVRDVSVPVAVTGAANELASGNDDFAGQLLTAAAVAPIPLAAKGAVKVLKPVVDNRATRAVAGTAKKLTDRVLDAKLPWAQTVDEVVAKADPNDILPSGPVIGLRSAPNLRAVGARLGERFDAAKQYIDPQGLAKALLRAQVKPAPTAFKGKEVADFENVMARPSGLREVASYADIIGGVPGMAKRGLGKIEDMNRATWNPIFDAQDRAAAKYNEAIDQVLPISQAGDAELAEYLTKHLGEDFTKYAEPMRGISTKEVRDVALEMARQDAMGANADKSNIDLYPYIDEQWRRYAADPTARFTGFSGDIPMRENIPLREAHAQKSMQQKVAYNQGIPDVNSPTRRVAAEYIGHAHNQVLDALKQKLMSQSSEPLPLPTPIINMRKLPVEDIVGLLSIFDSEGKNIKRTFPGAQKDWITRKPTAEEISTAAMEDPVNKLLMQDADGIAHGYIEGNVAADLESPEALETIQDMVEASLAEDKAMWRARQEAARAAGKQLPLRAPRVVQENIKRYRQDATDDLEAVIRNDYPSSSEIVDQLVAEFRNVRVPTWQRAQAGYAEAAADLPKKMENARKLDKVMAPWLKLEAPLERAYGRAGNRERNIGFSLGSGVLGALGGVGADWYNDKKLDDPLKSAALGAASAMIAERGARTPFGPRALYDVGAVGKRLTKEATLPLLNVPKTLSVDAIDALLSSIPIDWADRVRARKYNDAPADSTNNERIAEKKGASK